MVAASSTPVVVGRCRLGCGGSWDPTLSFGGGPTDDESGVTWQQTKTEPRPRSWRTMTMLLSVITLSGSSLLVLSLHPCCSGGNPDLDLLDWTMAAPNVVTPLEGIIFRGVCWLEWCRGGSVERLVFYCIDDDGSWRRGLGGRRIRMAVHRAEVPSCAVVASMAHDCKGYADLCPEDGLLVNNSDDLFSLCMRFLLRVCLTGCAVPFTQRVSRGMRIFPAPS
jgi:hypothetical protein